MGQSVQGSSAEASPSPIPRPERSALPSRRHMRKLCEWIHREVPSLAIPRVSRDDLKQLRLLVVKAKLMRLTKYEYSESAEIENGELLACSVVLSTIRDLSSRYLTSDWDDSKLLHEQLFPDDSLSRHHDSESGFLSVRTKALCEELSEGNTLRVFLVLTEGPDPEDDYFDPNPNVSKRSLREIMNPERDRLPVFRRMGVFRWALMIGPWYIDWDESSLCIPRRITKRHNYLSKLFVGIISGPANIQRTLESLASVLVRWNTVVVYYDIGPRVHYMSTGNCHEFVADVLCEMGLPHKFTTGGMFDGFFQDIKLKGGARMVYQPSPKVLEASCFRHLKNAPYRFSSHHELDEFYANSLDAHIDFFDVKYEEDFAVLNAYDSVFWTKYRIFSELGDEEGVENAMPDCCDPEIGRCPVRQKKQQVVDFDFHLVNDDPHDGRSSFLSGVTVLADPEFAGSDSDDQEEEGQRTD